MPTEAALSDLSTEDIVLKLHGELETDYTTGELSGELKYRLIPSNDTAITYTEYRGGIRPTHIPTH